VTGRERVAIVRVVILCLAWALGEAMVWQLRAGGIAQLVPALLAAAAFMATAGVGRSGGGGDETYWRGRRIDRDKWN
jgi:type IV secretory pathway VirB2 component (pilin)